MIGTSLQGVLVMNKAERINRTVSKVRQRIKIMKKIGMFNKINLVVEYGRAIARDELNPEGEVQRCLERERNYWIGSRMYAVHEMPMGNCGNPHCSCCAYERYEKRHSKRKRRHRENLEVKRLVEEFLNE